MKEKLYDIAIDNPLTSARRKALNQHITRDIHVADVPLSYEWDSKAAEILRITAEPVTFEVKSRDLRLCAALGPAPADCEKERAAETRDPIDPFKHRLCLRQKGRFPPDAA
jgi:hypothetical protein